MSEPGEPDLQESNALGGLRARSHAGTSGVLGAEEEEDYSDHNSYDLLCHELETLLEDQTACDAQVTDKPFAFVAKIISFCLYISVELICSREYKLQTRYDTKTVSTDVHVE